MNTRNRIYSLFMLLGSYNIHAHHTDFKNSASDEYSVSAFDASGNPFGTISKHTISTQSGSISWEDTLKNPSYWILEYPGLQMKVDFGKPDTVAPSGFHSKKIKNSRTESVYVTITHDTNKKQSIDTHYVVQQTSSFVLPAGQTQNYYYDPSNCDTITIWQATSDNKPDTTVPSLLLSSSEKDKYTLTDSQGIEILKSAYLEVNITDSTGKKTTQYPIHQSIQNNSGISVKCEIQDSTGTVIQNISDSFQSAATATDNSIKNIFYDASVLAQGKFVCTVLDASGNPDPTYNVYSLALNAPQFAHSNTITCTKDTHSSNINLTFTTSDGTTLASDSISQKNILVQNNSSFGIKLTIENATQNLYLGPQDTVTLTTYTNPQDSAYYWDITKNITITTLNPQAIPMTDPFFAGFSPDGTISFKTITLQYNDTTTPLDSKKTIQSYLTQNNSSIIVSDLKCYFDTKHSIGLQLTLGNTMYNATYVSSDKNNAYCSAAKVNQNWQTISQQYTSSVTNITTCGIDYPNHTKCSCTTLLSMLPISSRETQHAISKELKDRCPDKDSCCDDDPKYSTATQKVTLNALLNSIVVDQVESNTIDQAFENLLAYSAEAIQ